VAAQEPEKSSFAPNFLKILNDVLGLYNFQNGTAKRFFDIFGRTRKIVGHIF